MKKIALLLLVAALSVVTLASCGSDESDTQTDAQTNAPVSTSAATSDDSAETTAPVTTNAPETTTGAETTAEEPEVTTEGAPETTDGEAAPSTPAATEGEEETTTEAETSAEPETTETEAAPSTPETPDVASITVWEDNNGEDGVFYEITANEDGTVTVNYTKEDYASAEAHYGYAGSSWVNMKADISGIYTGQSKLVLKAKGEAGKSLLIKPFDDQAYEKTLNFDGSEQEITIELKNVKDNANKVIIMFGDGGATDSTGTFTILEAYFAD